MDYAILSRYYDPGNIIITFKKKPTTKKTALPMEGAIIIAVSDLAEAIETIETILTKLEQEE